MNTLHNLLSKLRSFNPWWQLWMLCGAVFVVGACSGEAAPSGTATPDGRWGVVVVVEPMPAATKSPSPRQFQSAYMIASGEEDPSELNNTIPEVWQTTSAENALYQVTFTQTRVEIERCDYINTDNLGTPVVKMPGISSGSSDFSYYRAQRNITVEIVKLPSGDVVDSKEYVFTGPECSPSMWHTIDPVYDGFTSSGINSWIVETLKSAGGLAALSS